MGCLGKGSSAVRVAGHAHAPVSPAGCTRGCPHRGQGAQAEVGEEHTHCLAYRGLVLYTPKHSTFRFSHVFAFWRYQWQPKSAAAHWRRIWWAVDSAGGICCGVWLFPCCNLSKPISVPVFLPPRTLQWYKWYKKRLDMFLLESAAICSFKLSFCNVHIIPRQRFKELIEYLFLSKLS